MTEHVGHGAIGILLRIAVVFNIFSLVLSKNTRFDVTVPLVYQDTGSNPEPILNAAFILPRDTLYITRIEHQGQHLERLHHLGVHGGVTAPPSGLPPGGELAQLSDHTLMPSDYFTREHPIAGLPQVITPTRRIFPSDQPGGTLQFPPKSGFPVGPSVGIYYITISIHFKEAPKPIQNDTRLIFSFLEKVEAEVGIVDIYVMNINIPPLRSSVTDCVVRIRDDYERLVFGTHVHTHALGVFGVSYKVEPGGKWIEIARNRVKNGSPFNEVADGVTFNEGDIVAIRCGMQNTHNQIVHFGFSDSQEMCLHLFYVIYGADVDVTVKQMTETTYLECLNGPDEKKALNNTWFPEEVETICL